MKPEDLINKPSTIMRANKTPFSDERNSPAPPPFPNMAFKAQVMDISVGKATLSTEDGFIWQTDKTSIVGDIGDILHFKVDDRGADRIVLRQIFIEDKLSKAYKSKLSSQAVLTIMKSGLSQPVPPSSKLGSGVSAMKEAESWIETIAKASNRSAVKELLSIGFSFEQAELESTARLMERLEAAYEPLPANTQNDSAVRKALFNRGLPQTKENIDSLMQVIELIPKETPDKKLAVEALREGKPLILRELYMSRFKGSVEKPSACDDFLPVLSSLFISQEISVTDENKSIGLFLIGNNIPVTGDNIEKIKFLSSMPGNIDLQAVLGKAAENMAAGRKLGDIDLMALPLKSSGDPSMYEEMEKALPKMRAEHIEELLQNRTPVTLSNLASASSTPLKSPVRPSQEALKADAQLKEIQLRMTHEAAARLIGKNVSIHDLLLGKALETLKTEDRKRLSLGLSASGAPDTEENVEALDELELELKRLSSKKAMPPSFYRDHLQRGKPATLKSAVASLYASKASSVYELNAATLNPAYGDSIKNAGEALGNILNRLGVPSSNENVRAAAMLSKAKIDITAENLKKVKYLDARLQRLIGSLHPKVAASMLNNGINPLKAKIDDLLDFIDKYEVEFTDGLKGKIAEHIIQMDRNEELDPETRKGVIAVYRMLSVISSSGAALGAALKAGAGETLGSLFDIAKNFTSQKGADFKVSDEAGKVPVSAENSIRNLIIRGAAQRYEAEFDIDSAYTEEIIKSLLGKLEGIPEEVARNHDVFSLPLEDANALVPYKASQVEENRALQILNELSCVSPSIVAWMQKNALPLIAKNILLVKSLTKNANLLGDALNDLESQIPETGEIIKELLSSRLDGLAEATPEEILDSLDSRLELMRQSASPSELDKIIKAQKAIQTGRIVRRAKPASFQLPLKLHDATTSFNLYILNDQAQEDEARIFFSLTTGALGRIQIYAGPDESGETEIEINAPSAAACSFLKRRQEQLKAALSFKGVHYGDIAFGIEAPRNLISEDIEKSVL
ncbi:MAG: DUF6240 domain-containing protein [Clostridiales bacterium]|jgi:hypothetical protein|nr:DUF6240 domain-containing protein [Clostridiales bacterium]